MRGGGRVRRGGRSEGEGRWDGEGKGEGRQEEYVKGDVRSEVERGWK